MDFPDLFKLADDIRSGLGFGDNDVRRAVRQGQSATSSKGRGANPTRRVSKPTAAEQAKAYKRQAAEAKARAAAKAKKKPKITGKLGKSKSSGTSAKLDRQNARKKKKANSNAKAKWASYAKRNAK